MTFATPTKRQHTPNTLPSGKGLGDWIKPILASTVGGKYLVAITGSLLTVFVIVHMLGNLQFFGGPAAINSYAEMLKSNPVILWGARGTLLLLLIVHMILAIRLKLRSVAARPVGYVCHATVQASLASRTMILTGLVIFAFIAFHLAHYTLGVVHGVTIPKGETVVVATVASDSNTPINRPQKLPVDVTLNYLELRDAQGRHDVHAMMYHGFRNPLIVALYVVAQLVLFFHLWHGVGSMFQSLGLNTPRLHRAVRRLAMLVASGVLAGNLSVLAGAWWWTTPPAWPRFQADAAGHPTIPFWTP